jgi:hypothetical protein
VLIWMSLFLLAVAVVCVLLSQPLRDAFMANPVFNGMVLGVLAIGVFINYRQVMILGPEVAWIEAFRHSDTEEEPTLPKTRLLGSMALMLGGRQGERFSLSTMSMRTLLDGIRSRLDESRDLSRYLIGLLVFLGLLGTFWGLLDTLRSVGDVIGGLSIGGRDAATVFEELKSGLEQPLAGMGTAFSSSLFGLASALVLGFIDLQATHAQNRFYNDLEEWLSSQTRLGSGALSAEGDGSVPAYIQALLEQTADSLDKLQRTMARTEEERRAADNRLIELTEQIGNLAEQTREEQKGLKGLTRMQNELQNVLSRLADAAEQSDEQERAVRDHLRHISGTLNDMRNDFSADRERLTEDLREELRLLTRTVSHISSDRGG